MNIKIVWKNYCVTIFAVCKYIWWILQITLQEVEKASLYTRETFYSSPMAYQFSWQALHLWAQTQKHGIPLLRYAVVFYLRIILQLSARYLRREISRFEDRLVARLSSPKAELHKIHRAALYILLRASLP